MSGETRRDGRAAAAGPGPETLPAGKLDAALLASLLGELAGEAGARPPELVLGPGPGRDVAVVDAGGPRLLLLTSDPVTFASDELAHYLVTVNVNDVATAGGTPRWLLATALLPEGGARAESVRRLFRALRAACARYGVALVGGHTEVTDAVTRPVVSGALVGEVERERLVRSDGTRPGDAILCMKGVPLEGGSLLAREQRDALRAAGIPEATLAACAGYLFDPGIGVLEDARAACAAARVHAMHDPTEGGLATALWEMAEAAGVGLRVEAAALPVLEPARALCAALGLDPLGVIASGALLVAVAPEDARAVIRSCTARGIPCARIATATGPEPGLVLVEPAGERPLPRFDQDELARLQP